MKCYEALELEGFHRFRKEGVDWPLHDGFHVWVGLNTALQTDRVELLPFLGLHVVPLERLWTSLKVGDYRGKYDRGTATYAINMGQLPTVGDERMFTFSPQQSDQFVSSECKRLARLYASAGLQYARSIASYEALLPRLQERVDALGGYPERVASCLYLMGRKTEARQFVEGFVTDQRSYFDGFAIPFLDRLKNEGVT